MKRTRPWASRALALLLAAVMLLSLIACDKESNATSGNGSSPTDPSITMPPSTETKPSIPFVLTSNFVLVYDKEMTEIASLDEALSYLVRAIYTVYDFAPPCIGDSDAREPKECEILIGSTNRLQSKEAMRGLGIHDYTYSIESENVIVICGGSAEATAEAVRQFCASVLKYTGSSEDVVKNCTLLTGDAYIHRAEYPYQVATLNGAAFSEWTIAIGSQQKSVTYAEEIACRLGAYTGERIPTVLAKDLTGEEKNVIAVGCVGRHAKTPRSFDVEYYLSASDKKGSVISLFSSKGNLWEMVEHLLDEVTAETNEISVSLAIPEQDRVHFSIEDKMQRPWTQVSKTTKQLYDGVTYIEQVFADPYGTPYRTYALLLDPDKVTLHMGTSNDGYDRTLESADRQTTQQHMQAAVKNGENIIAAVNANFFNINGDYSPRGLAIKDGVVINGSEAAYPFFAITEDGEVIVDEGTTYNRYVRQGKKFELGFASWAILLKDGFLTPDAMDANGGHHPRTLLGVGTDGTIILGVIDGRQEGYSNGANFTHCALWMRSLGAEVAVNLDGGGSSNLILRNPTRNTYKIYNSPSDGGLRKVYNSVMVELK